MKTEILKAAEIDYDGGVERFSGHESIYHKFLKMFPDDSNYRDLLTAIQENDLEKAFTCAHTLKGTSGNLSLTVLYRDVSLLVEELRAKKTDKIETLLATVKDSYERTVNAIKEASADE